MARPKFRIGQRVMNLITGRWCWIYGIATRSTSDGRQWPVYYVSYGPTLETPIDSLEEMHLMTPVSAWLAYREEVIPDDERQRAVRP